MVAWSEDELRLSTSVRVVEPQVGGVPGGLEDLNGDSPAVGREPRGSKRGPLADGGDLLAAPVEPGELGELGGGPEDGREEEKAVPGDGEHREVHPFGSPDVLRDWNWLTDRLESVVEALSDQRPSRA